MTTIDVARTTLYDEFLAEWNGATGMDLDQTAFENEEFDPEQYDESARVTMRMLESVQSSLGSVGNRRFDRFALLFVDIWTPADKGMERGGTLAQAALTIFEAKTFTDTNGEPVWTTNATIRELGSDGSKYQTQVEIEVRFFDLK